MVDDFLQIRRIWMHSFGEFGPCDAWPAMTSGAAMCGKRFGAGLHAGRIVDGSWRLVKCVAIDRRRAHLGQRPSDNARVFGGPCDTIIASEKEDRRAGAGKDCQPANLRKDRHVGLPRVVVHANGGK